MEEKIKVPVPPKKFPPPPPNLSKAESVKSDNEEVKKVPPQPLSQNLPPKTDIVKENAEEKVNVTIDAKDEKKEKKRKVKKEVDKLKLLSWFGIVGGGCLLIVFLVLLIVL